ncbi:hypothetical protein H0G86_001659 [Trichoderma simmonsii]|uniref:Uncharacterized protein n=1 Tax=Trichoderma simmonsii TaxID=1491479 RepID=A0A8G0PBE7_9HYPO|nr:hypothetical protein H0G86_001659 [Trichoderma simmonsii]
MPFSLSAGSIFPERLRPNRPHRPPTGSDTPVVGDGPDLVGQTWMRLLPIRLFFCGVWVLAALWAVFVGSVKKTRLLGAAISSRIRLMDANPAAAGGIDELRQRLRYLVAVGLITSAFCANAVARVLPEERSVISYRVVMSLGRVFLFVMLGIFAGVLGVGATMVTLIIARGGAYRVAVLAFLTIAALVMSIVTLSALDVSRDSTVGSTRYDGDLERQDTSPLHST